MVPTLNSFLGSTSKAVSQTVSEATTTALASSLNLPETVIPQLPAKFAKIKSKLTMQTLSLILQRSGASLVARNTAMKL